jgi:ParB-like chromosome segregation protein Spo0J
MHFHPLANVFPLMDGAEFDELIADIKANGLVEPIVMFEDMILDGRNRHRACIEGGIEPRFTAYTGDDPAAFVISRNIRRRHLTAQQKCELIAKLIKAAPEKSDRQIAKQAQVHNETVAAVRKKVEGRDGIRHVEKRIDSKGRKQPAQKKRPTVEHFKRDIAAKKAAVAPAPPTKTVRDTVAPDEELALLREFAQWFVSERVRVIYDPKDRDEWRGLFGRVKAALGSTP